MCSHITKEIRKDFNQNYQFSILNSQFIPKELQ